MCVSASVGVWGGGVRRRVLVCVQIFMPRVYLTWTLNLLECACSFLIPIVSYDTTNL